MDLTLGLAMSATAVRFLLTEGSDGRGTTLEHDEFDVSRAGGVSAPSISEHVVAVVLGTQAIASTRGHALLRVGVTWTQDVDTEAALVLDSLTRLGIPNVVPVPMLDAAEAFACLLAEAQGSRQTAVFLVESEAAVATTVSSAGGAVSHIASQVYSGRFVPGEALRSLAVSMFSHLTEEPDAVLVVGAGWDFDGISAQLEEVSPLRVVAPGEAEFALARGAAIASLRLTRAIVSPAGEPVEGTGFKEPIKPVAGDGAALPLLFVPRTARLAMLDGPPKTEPTPALTRVSRKRRVITSSHVLTAVLIGALASFLVSTTLAFTDRTAIGLPAPGAAGADAGRLTASSQASLSSASRPGGLATAGPPAAPTAQPLFIPGLSGFSLVAPVAGPPAPPPAASVAPAASSPSPAASKLPAAPDVLALLSGLFNGAAGGAGSGAAGRSSTKANLESGTQLTDLYDPLMVAITGPVTVDLPDVGLPIPLNSSGTP